jgi:hypothetical protein
VLCLIVVPLPPDENPFALQLNIIIIIKRSNSLETIVFAIAVHVHVLDGMYKEKST